MLRGFLLLNSATSARASSYSRSPIFVWNGLSFPAIRTRLGPPKSELSAVSLENAEEPVVVTIGTVDSHLVDAAHLAVHGFPPAAAAEGRRWGVGDRANDRDHRGVTLRGLASRKALAGTAWAGSSTGCRRKKWTRHGCRAARPQRAWRVFWSWRGRFWSMTGRKPRLPVAALDLYRSLELHVLKISAVAGGVDDGLRDFQQP